MSGRQRAAGPRTVVTAAGGERGAGTCAEVTAGVKARGARGETGHGHGAACAGRVARGRGLAARRALRGGGSVGGVCPRACVCTCVHARTVPPARPPGACIGSCPVDSPRGAPRVGSPRARGAHVCVCVCVCVCPGPGGWGWGSLLDGGSRAATALGCGAKSRGRATAPERAPAPSSARGRLLHHQSGMSKDPGDVHEKRHPCLSQTLPHLCPCVPSVLFGRRWGSPNKYRLSTLSLCGSHPRTGQRSESGPCPAVNGASSWLATDHRGQLGSVYPLSRLRPRGALSMCLLSPPCLGGVCPAACLPCAP